MYKGYRILAIIPARGGSKGIIHKNIVDLSGKPLISYTIEAGKNSKYCDYVMVSTDDVNIAKTARLYGAEIPFLRPSELASDTAKTVDVIVHAVTELRKIKNEYDVLVLLQPTSPLRTAQDIDAAIEKFFIFDCLPLVSVCEVEDSPVLIRSIEREKLVSILGGTSTCRRQDMPLFYKVNGAIYINSISEISSSTSFNDNPIPFIMKKSHSIDIDEEIDLVKAKYYLSIDKDE